MEQESIINAHNKEEYSPMHTGGLNTPLTKMVIRRCVTGLIVLTSILGLTSCIDNITVKVKPITVGNSSGGKTTVYFRDNDHDELFLSTTNKHSELWDTNANIAILYKPIFFKVSGDTLHILGEKPDYFRPERSDANISYHWREGNPLCYEKEARADGYLIVHSLWSIVEYNQ